MKVLEWDARSPLTRVLVIEGEVNSVEELTARLAAEGLYVFAREEGLLGVLFCIVGPSGYKEAARIRKLEGGVNVFPESLGMFQHCAKRLIEIGEDVSVPVMARALALHNAASCLAAWNGVQIDRQQTLNEWSVELLEQVPEANRGADWWEGYRKPVVGLFEAGHKEWNPFVYGQIVRRMIENGTKDAPGRLEYLIRRVAADLTMMADLVIEEGIGAENQRYRLQGLLVSLQAVADAA